MPSNPSTNRIALRRRADLVISTQRQHGETVYVLKDPLSLRYFRLDDYEYAIFRMLNARSTYGQILQRLECDYPQLLITEPDVRAFVASLYHNALVIGDRPGQGLQLKQRHDLSRKQRRQALIRNVLAIRLPGFDPTALLNTIYPWSAWFFSKLSLFAVMASAIVALSVLAVQITTLPAELVAMHQYFGPGNWLLLALTLAITKMLHEFGHALSCRKFDGECHEIGVMLLVLTPCLYCDVSDSWLLSNRWHRAAIAAAGMYVEVMLASLATLVWANTDPGTVHYLALQVMLICGASTLLFNGNPLARYDGYYILADLVDVPNLRNEAAAALRAVVWRILTGVERQPCRPSWKLALFGLGVVLYRWVLLTCILWFLYQFFNAQGLDVVWQFIAATTLMAIVVTPLWRLIKELSKQEVRKQMKHRHVIATSAIAGSIAGIAFLLPLPCYVYSPCELRVAGATPVYAPRTASLERLFVAPGQAVQTGQPLAQLTNVDLDLETTRLESATQSHQMLLHRLKYQRYDNDDAASAIPQAEELLIATREQLDERRRDLAAMTLTSSRPGVVLVPHRKAHATDHLTLATWSGSPLDDKNASCVLAQGDVVCEVGDPKQLEAVLVVDQANVEELLLGQTADVVFDAYPWQTLRGEVGEIARQKLDQTPASLSVRAGGGVASKVDAQGVEHPISTSYTVRVPLAGQFSRLTPGMRGTAKIRVGQRTIANRLWQTLCRTFHFGL